MLTSPVAISTVQTVNRLYARMNLRAPHIISCESPWQLLLMPLIFPVLLRGERAAGGKRQLLAKLMPELRSDPKLQLWHRFWLRIDSEYDDLARVGLLDMEHSLQAVDHEIDGFLKPSREAWAAHLLMADLTTRIQCDYNEIDPELCGYSLPDQIKSMLIDGYGEILSRYLLGLNGLYLPEDPQSNSICSSKVVCFRPHELSACFLHTQLGRIIRSIQFFEIGNDGCACLMFPHCCIVLDNAAALKFDQAGRLHCETGPAVTFSDGYSVYSLEGTLVNRDLVENPEWLTTEKICSESNQEIRRLMLARYGVEKFLVDSQAQEVHMDEFGVLFKKQLPGGDPLVFVKVVNSTAEHDGTFRTYFLRVPPWIETAHGAVAWTFDLRQDQYNPAQQT